MIPIPHFSEEIIRWNKGEQYVAGVDEVGRGPLAGPVVAAAVIFEPFTKLSLEIRDSKNVSVKKREALAPEIKKLAFTWSIGLVEAIDVDTIGIVPATFYAMKMALEGLSVRFDYCLVDGAFPIEGIDITKQKPIVKGDSSSISIAAASILAKVYRDDLMLRYHKTYPEYGFDSHVGYGTKRHREAISTYGISPIHRKSFLKNIV